jgi:hypothetical protein
MADSWLRVITRWTRRLARGRRPARGPRPGRREATGLEYLSDRELVLAWRRTSQDLTVVSDPVRRLSLVRTRQYLLDELWTRDRLISGSADPAVLLRDGGPGLDL